MALNGWPVAVTYAQCSTPSKEASKLPGQHCTARHPGTPNKYRQAPGQEKYPRDSRSAELGLIKPAVLLGCGNMSA